MAGVAGAAVRGVAVALESETSACRNDRKSSAAAAAGDVGPGREGWGVEGNTKEDAFECVS